VATPARQCRLAFLPCCQQCADIIPNYKERAAVRLGG
jgi:hypothetical protein